MPHSKFTDEEYDNTLEQLRSVMEKCPKEAIMIIGGDFNAPIGTTKILEPHTRIQEEK